MPSTTFPSSPAPTTPSTSASEPRKIRSKPVKQKATGLSHRRSARRWRLQETSGQRCARRAAPSYRKIRKPSPISTSASRTSTNLPTSTPNWGALVAARQRIAVHGMLEVGALDSAHRLVGLPGRPAHRPLLCRSHRRQEAPGHAARGGVVRRAGRRRCSLIAFRRVRHAQPDAHRARVWPAPDLRSRSKISSSASWAGSC